MIGVSRFGDLSGAGGDLGLGSAGPSEKKDKSRLVTVLATDFNSHDS